MLESLSLVDHYRRKGYAIVRQLFSQEELDEIAQAVDGLYAEGIAHPRSFRHANLLFLIQDQPGVGKVLRFCHWPAYHQPVLARYRTDARIGELLAPLIGSEVKQIINQVVWKTPGSVQSSYGFHQDARFRRPASAYRDLGASYVQTALAIDPHTTSNGCMVFVEGSHLRGDLSHHNARSVYEEDISLQTLSQLGLETLPRIEVLLNPGDVALWHPYLLHGSGSNRSTGDRRTYVNGYVTASACDRGEWAFRLGEPVALGDPVLVQYEDLFTRPEPHYIQGHPNPVTRSAEG